MSSARARLKIALPHFATAASMAKLQTPDGEVMLAIISKKPDGSGKLTATFEFDSLMQDLLELLGYKSLDELIAEEENEDG